MDNGAKQGLELKMRYWKEKDFQYEYGVSIGACINIVADIMGEKFLDPMTPPEHIINTIKKVFAISLGAKEDSDISNMFSEYYHRKTHPEPEKTITIQ